MASRFRRKKNGFGAKIRFGEDRDEWFDIPFPHEEEALAQDRAKRLQRMAKLMVRAERHAEARIILEEAAKERSEKAFRAVEVMVEGLSPEPPAEPKKPLTFREVTHLWTSGALHERFPDEVRFKEKEGRDADQGAIAAFFPVIGDKTIAELTDQDIEAAKACIPKDSAPRTRAAYCRRLRFVLRLAVRVLKAAPSHPEVSIPKARNASEFTFLYPDEEAKLARASGIPFAYRFLYAFLARNGTRISETLQLTWDHVNLETGTIHLDKAWTKTRRARFFKVEPDVLAALRLQRESAPDATTVFTGARGKKLTRGAVRAVFPAHIRKAGIDRPEAIGDFADVRALTVHDLRASFVTLARLHGRKDRWIRDHSGHESPSQLDKYDRFVRHAEELHLGWFSPMWSVLGMVDSEETLAHVMGQSWAKGIFPSVKMQGLPFHSEPVEQPETVENPEESPVAGPPIPAYVASGPAGKPTPGQKRASLAQPSGATASPVAPVQTDPIAAALAEVEATLGRAIDRATQAGEWETVRILARELEARRLAREAAAAKARGVASLDAARRKKEER